MKLRRTFAWLVALFAMGALVAGCTRGVITTPGGGGGGSTSGGSTSSSTSTTSSTTSSGGTVETIETAISGRTNLTRIISYAGFMWALEGFNIGQAQGRLLHWTVDTVDNADPLAGVEPVVATADAGSPIAAIFSNPFDLAADEIGQRMFITDGFNIQNGGQVLMLEQGSTGTSFVISNLTRNATQPQNPAFLLYVSDTVLAEGPFLFFTEYNGVPNGLVRRIDLTDPQNPTVDVFMNGLNFPADLATDGANLFIAEAGNNRVLRVALDQAVGNLPLAPNSAGVDSIINGTNQQQMRQPFELVFDGVNGLFVEEGMGITLGQLPPLGQANGQIQYIPQGATEAFDIGLNGLSNPSGLEVFGPPDRVNNATATLFFCEALATPQGTMRRVFVDVDQLVATEGLIVDQGLNTPFDVALEPDGTVDDNGLPNFTENLVEYTVGFDGGQANALVRRASFTP